MSALYFNPGFLILISGILLLFFPIRIRRHICLFMPLIFIIHVWIIPGTASIAFKFMGIQLMPLYIHPYTKIFASAFIIALFAGSLFGLLQANIKELSAAFVSAGCAVGITFSGDLVTFALFWEIMMLSSVILIWSAGTRASGAAGIRYLYLHLISGAILITGAVLYIYMNSNYGITQVNLEFLINEKNIGLWMVLVGVLVNAAAPPFSAWLPDSYPSASPFASVFLSAFTTKTAVFILITVFAGAEVLIYVGLVMVIYGIIYALMENDIRRILSYSVINQVGFMVCGAGIGGTLALNGAATHAFCHIMYKALLFMSAGAVIHMTDKNKCTQLGGIYRSMKFTTIFALIGAAAISSFPFTSGYVSKALITNAAAAADLTFVWYILLAGAAGVFLHAGIKYPWFVFFNRDSGLRPKDPPMNMLASMGFLAALCIIPGLFPSTIYFMLPDGFSYQPYSIAGVAQQIQLLIFSGIAFFVLLPFMKRTETVSLDFDWVYRIVLKKLILVLSSFYDYILELEEILLNKVEKVSESKILDVFSPGGFFTKTYSVGSTVILLILSLAVVLVLYYISSGI